MIAELLLCEVTTISNLLTDRQALNENSIFAIHLAEINIPPLKFAARGSCLVRLLGNTPMHLSSSYCAKPVSQALTDQLRQGG